MRPRVFEDTVLPHLDAAFNYVRWLTRNDADAEKVVQDACVRAMRFFSSLRADDARAWLFSIVRNTWYSRVSRAGAPFPLKQWFYPGERGAGSAAGRAESGARAESAEGDLSQSAMVELPGVDAGSTFYTGVSRCSTITSGPSKSFLSF
jgi:DNA-directed RNA polymerase specialized sigma24 family protein